ncbi:hypothetical protein [Williamsia maris]|uniref:Phospholipase D-like protein n=1 Tax=Williamsia maris TaxID=72806 RepID=A0ABT1HBY8_9NOCA|nr:hypothetical protein [Williamsia maris]MCP2175763.1 hypothetical protein [Williamsia maris]
MGFSECARTRGCNMFPHYMEVAGWLALAAVVLAWVAMAAFVTIDLMTRSTASTRTRWRAVAIIWLLPVVGVIAYLVATRRSRRRA